MFLYPCYRRRHRRRRHHRHGHGHLIIVNPPVPTKGPPAVARLQARLLPTLLLLLLLLPTKIKETRKPRAGYCTQAQQTTQTDTRKNSDSQRRNTTRKPKQNEDHARLHHDPRIPESKMRATHFHDRDPEAKMRPHATPPRSSPEEANQTTTDSPKRSSKEPNTYCRNAAQFTAQTLLEWFRINVRIDL